MKPYYQDKHCTIYHGDCREILPDLPKVDLVLTDPPYGLGFKTMESASISNKAELGNYHYGDWNDEPINWGLLWELLTTGKKAICWGGNYYPMPPSQKWLVWDKDNTGNFADCELAWTNIKGSVRKFKFRWNGMLQENMKNKEIRQHPTQKPVPLMCWCIEQAGEVETILDPFMGSGTTLRAAKDLNRHCIGIELEEKYCEIAVSRLKQQVLNL